MLSNTSTDGVLVFLTNVVNVAVVVDVVVVVVVVVVVDVLDVVDVVGVVVDISSTSCPNLFKDVLKLFNKGSSISS